MRNSWLEATYHLNRAIANAALELWKDAEAAWSPSPGTSMIYREIQVMAKQVGTSLSQKET